MPVYLTCPREAEETDWFPLASAALTALVSRVARQGRRYLEGGTFPPRAHPAGAVK